MGVFWDIENCAVPSGLDPYVVRPNIERALRTSGFLGPIYVSGYVNINTICRAHTLESLTESGITIHHVPSGGMDSSDRALLIDVMFWTMRHSPPAHILLITGDTDFSVLMHKLRLLGYNVLLAAPFHQHMSTALVHAASKIWIWPDVVVGEAEGLVAETHIPGAPLPDRFGNKKKEGKPREDSCEDLGPEVVKDVPKGSGKIKLQDGGWLPPRVADMIISIVIDRPGIALGDLTKELTARNINPKLYGYHDYHQCLSRMEELEIQYVDGACMRDRLLYYVASHVAEKRSAILLPGKDGQVSGGNAVHKEASESIVGNEGKSKESTGENGESLTKKNANVASLSWGSRLLSFIKGS